MAAPVLLELSQPAVEGESVVYDLPAGYEPKGCRAWVNGMQAFDGWDPGWQWCVGLGAYRGGVVQQRSHSIRSLNASASSDIAVDNANDCLLSLIENNAGSAVRALEINLVTMGTGFIELEWTTISSSIIDARVFLVVYGGANTDCYVGNFTTVTNAAAQNVTGMPFQPDAIYMLGSTDVGFGAFAVGIEAWCFGFAKKGEAGRMVEYSESDNGASATVAMRSRSDRIIGEQQWGGDLMAGRLDTTVANWPADGVRVLYDSNPIFPAYISYLAIQTTDQITTGTGTAPTTGTAPVTQTLGAGFTPGLLETFHWNLPAQTTINTSHADLGALGMGAYDGTQHAWAGFMEDDGAATMHSTHAQSTAAAIVNYTPVTPAVVSQAAASFSGTDAVLSWNPRDTVARQYHFVIWEDAGGGGGPQSYSVSTGDVAGASESVARGVAAARAAADTASAADSLARALAAARSTANSAPAGEAAARSAVTARGVADSAPASAVLARSFTGARGVTDAAPATAATGRAAVAARSVADSAPAVDSADTSGAQSRGTTDAAPAADALGRLLSALRGVSDTAGAAEEVEGVKVTLRSTTDSAPASETVTRMVGIARATTDAAPAAAALTRLVMAARALSVAVTGSEALTRALAAPRALTDSAPAAAAINRGTVTARATTDTATASDAVAARAGSEVQLDEVVTGSEGVTRTFSGARAVADSAPAADVVSRFLAATRGAVDAAPASEAVSMGRAFARALTDAVSATEAVGTVRATARAVADAVTGSEAVARLATLARGTVDSVHGSDSASRGTSVDRSTADSAPATDSVIAQAATPFARMLRGVVRRSRAWALVVPQAATRARARVQRVWARVR